MKINLDMIAKMVEAGATGSVILAFLREHEALYAPRKAKDRQRKSAEYARRSAEKVRKSADVARATSEATVTDTPRARLFREGKPALLTLGISNSRAGALITEWLKLSHDDDQLVIATILKAQELAVADAPGWILATLRGKTNGQRSQGNDRQSSGGDFFAGLEKVAANLAGDGAVAGGPAEEIPVGRVNIDG